MAIKYNGTFITQVNYKEGATTYTDVKEIKMADGTVVHKRIDITFHVNGGSGSNTNQRYTLGVDANVIAPNNPTRSGHDFKGWFAASSGGSALSFPRTLPSSDTTYYAQWMLSVVYHTVTYRTYYQDLLGTFSVEHGKYFTPPSGYYQNYPKGIIAAGTLSYIGPITEPRTIYWNARFDLPTVSSSIVGDNIEIKITNFTGYQVRAYVKVYHQYAYLQYDSSFIISAITTSTLNVAKHVTRPNTYKITVYFVKYNTSDYLLDSAVQTITTPAYLDEPPPPQSTTTT